MTIRVRAELSICTLPDAEALRHIGLLIDDACDRQSVADTDRAFALLEELQRRSLAPDLASTVHYFRGNAWANRRLARARTEGWAWEQPERQEEILEMRRAVQHEGFEQLDTIRQCQILTNLAGQFSSIGRFIDALELWDRTLRLEPRFGMALGNRGLGLSHYARSLFDPGHMRVMLAAAHDALAAAADGVYENPSYAPAQAIFEHTRRRIAARVNLEEVRKIDLQNHSLGASREEERYRAWCLQHRLLINPLNDLGALPIAACDVLTLPSLTVSGPGLCPPESIGFFNQMKQEFVSARQLYHEGITATELHYSDRDVRLYNTLDYPAYSFAVEKVRLAFRAAYSLFDKIAFFINDYFAIGLPLRQVSFRSIWFEPRGQCPYPLHPRLTSYENWPLRGLFWLSKDLFEERFQAVTEPDAAELNHIRNHLEHKYLQVHDSMGMGVRANEPAYFACRISRPDLEAKTLRILKLARAALIHLSLAVHREERLRVRQGSRQGVTVPLRLDVLENDWKR
jgi:LA2681-like HEPN